MSTWEVIKIAATYIWLHNVPEWIAQFKEMAPALVLFTGIFIGVVAEVINICADTEEEQS